MVLYLVLRAGLFLARYLPERLIAALCAGLFALAAPFSTRRRIVVANLTLMNRAGAPSARPAAVFASYGRYWGELLAVAARPERLLRRRLRVEGGRHLMEAKSRGPVCVLSGHLGNWDLLAGWLARGLPGFTVAAEELRPRALFRLFVAMRESVGCAVLPADGKGLRFFRLLRAGRPIGLMADRVFGAGSEGGGGQRAAPFLGGRRRFPSAGMDLARQAGAALLPIFLLREQGDYVIKIHPPFSGDEDPVIGYARALEEEVRTHPEQFCLLYPVHDAGEEEAGRGWAKGAAGP